ncbi:MAG TPA: hypothetical protein VFB74_36005 [Kribbellaceae bacterium]|nr:hypothetical protein [Kribbellaceae bacterium]
MRVHHYPAEYAGRVRDESARDFLVTVGLPAKHVLFTAAERDVANQRATEVHIRTGEE